MTSGWIGTAQAAKKWDNFDARQSVARFIKKPHTRNPGRFQRIIHTLPGIT
jgi:hypothetical protein